MAGSVFEIECPCCSAVLQVDGETEAVISHQAPKKPRLIEDLNKAVESLKGEEEKRDQIFRKQFEAEKTHGRVLEKKFDELLKKAKTEPAGKRAIRDIDLD